MLRKLEGLRKEFSVLERRMTAAIGRGADLETEAGGHQASQPALTACKAKRQAVERMAAGFPTPSPTADLGALSRQCDEGVQVLAGLEGGLAALEVYLPQVEAAVAESRRQKFEDRVFKGELRPQVAPRVAVAQPTPRAETEARGTHRASVAPAAPSAAAPSVAVIERLAEAIAQTRGLLAHLFSSSPPDMRPELEEISATAAHYSGRQADPTFATAHLGEMRRRLERLTRRARERLETTDRLRAECLATLGDLEALAVERKASPDLPELGAVIQAGKPFLEEEWPDPAAARRWLEDGRALAERTRIRAKSDAQRRTVLAEVAQALADLDYEVLSDPAYSVAFPQAPLAQTFSSPHGGGVVVSVAVDGSLLTEVLRFGDPGEEQALPSPSEVGRLERQTHGFCRDYDAVLAALGPRRLKVRENWRQEDEPARLRVVPRPPAQVEDNGPPETEHRRRRSKPGRKAASQSAT
jgi:hypothetical protein